MRIFLNGMVGAMAGLALGASGVASAQSVYLPPPGGGYVTPAFTYFEFEEFWFGGEKGELPQPPIREYIFSLAAEYGLTPWLALDASMSYAINTYEAQGDNDGLGDSLVGVRARLWDEFNYPDSLMPSVAVRVGAIIAGTYDTLDDGSFNSIGDGGSGVEFSGLFGKAFGDSGFGIIGDAGYRIRNNDIPDAWFGSVGLYKTIGSWSLRAGYRFEYSVSGVDIFSPEFTFSRFPEAQEVMHNIEAGVGYEFSNGMFLQVFGAKTVDGKNTGDKTFAGISLSIPFGARPDAGVAVLPQTSGKSGK